MSLASFRKDFTLEIPTSVTPFIAVTLASYSAAARQCRRRWFVKTPHRSLKIIFEVYSGFGGLPPASTPKPEKLLPGYQFEVTDPRPTD